MPGQPFTKVVPGDGTGTLTFEVPSFYAVDMESALAHVDASAAGDTTATLTVADQTGEDVATVPQGRTIAGGGQGRATWALRLAAEQAASPGGGGIDFETFPQAGDWLYAETTGGAGSPNGYGLDLRNDERVGIFSANDSIDVEAPNGQVTLSSLSGAGSGFIEIESDGSTETKGANIFSTLARGEGGEFTVRRGGAGLTAILSIYETGEAEFYLPFAGNYVAFYGAAGTALKINQADSAVFMPNLPIADPGVPGQLWNSGGFVAVSP